MTEAYHNGILYRLCGAGDALPPGTRVYRFTMPLGLWDMLTTLEGGEVKTEYKGAVNVRWDSGIWGTCKKEYVCVKATD